MAVLVVTSTFSQTKMAEDSRLKAHIIDLEKAGWNAFTTRDAAWFEANTTDEYLQITDEGITNKAEVISSLSDCTVKSFSLENFSMVKLNKKTIVLIYTATQEGVCGDERLPAKVQVAVNYIKRGGKWLEAFYMDSPIIE